MHQPALETYRKPHFALTERPFRIALERYDRPGLAVEPHWHEHFELLYFLEGSAVVDGAGERGPGDLAVFNPYDLHRVEVVRSPVLYWCAILDPSVLERRELVEDEGSCSALVYERARFPGRDSEAAGTGPASLAGSADPGPRPAPSALRFESRPAVPPEVAERFARMRLSFREGGPAADLRLLSDMYGVLADLAASGAAREEDAAAADVRRRAARDFEGLLRALEATVDEAWDVDRAARETGMSRFHFCRRFRAATGSSFAAYLRGLRLATARRLLADTALPVAEVADAVGWADSNNFCRLFRAAYGDSPGRWRRTALRAAMYTEGTNA